MARQVSAVGFCTPDKCIVKVDGQFQNVAFDSDNAFTIFQIDDEWYSFAKGTHFAHILTLMPTILNCDINEIENLVNTFPDEFWEILVNIKHLGRMWKDVNGVNIISFWSDKDSNITRKYIYYYIKDGEEVAKKKFHLMYESTNSFPSCNYQASDSFGSSFGNDENSVYQALYKSRTPDIDSNDFSFVNDFCQTYGININNTYLAMAYNVVPVSIACDYGINLSDEDIEEFQKAHELHANPNNRDDRYRENIMSKFRDNRNEYLQQTKWNGTPSKTAAEYHFMTRMDEGKTKKRNNMKISLNESQLHKLIKECVKNILSEKLEDDYRTLYFASGAAEKAGKSRNSVVDKILHTKDKNGQTRNRFTRKRAKGKDDYDAQSKRLYGKAQDSTKDSENSDFERKQGEVQRERGKSGEGCQRDIPTFGKKRDKRGF